MMAVEGSSCKAIAFKFGGQRALLTDFFSTEDTEIDVAAGAATFFFHFGDIGAFTPVWFGVIEPGDGVEARRFGSAAGNDGIGHADDG